MRTWVRAPIVTACGECGEKVAEGDPILVLESPTWGTLRKYRCPTHADEPVPADLPPLPTLTELLDRKPQLKMGHVTDGLPLDWKHRQTGDREPGEEG